MQITECVASKSLHLSVVYMSRIDFHCANFIVILRKFDPDLSVLPSPEFYCDTILHGEQSTLVSMAHIPPSIYFILCFGV